MIYCKGTDTYFFNWIKGTSLKVSLQEVKQAACHMQHSLDLWCLYLWSLSGRRRGMGRGGKGSREG